MNNFYITRSADANTRTSRTYWQSSFAKKTHKLAPARILNSSKISPDLFNNVTLTIFAKSLELGHLPLLYFQL